MASIDPKNPMQFRAYEKAAMAALAEMMLTSYKLGPRFAIEGISMLKDPILKTLQSKGPRNVAGVMAAAGIFAAVSWKGEGAEHKSIQCASWVSDAIDRMNYFGSIPAFAINPDEVGTPKHLEMRGRVEAKINEIFTKMDDFLTEDQKESIKSWLLWPDFEKLRASADAVTFFDKDVKEEWYAQSMTFWNTMNTFFPFANITNAKQMYKTIETATETHVNNFVAAQVDTFKKTSATGLASWKEQNTWLQDGAASGLNMLSFGVKVDGGLKLATPAQMAAIVIATLTTRQYLKLQQATIEGKYRSPW